MIRTTYLIQIRESLLIRLQQEIAELIRGELQDLVDKNPEGLMLTASGLDATTTSLVELVKVSTFAEPIGESRECRCTGYRLSILPAHVALYTGSGTPVLDVAISRICAGVSVLGIKCPPITYVSGEYYFPCSRAGTCSELAYLAREVLKLSPGADSFVNFEEETVNGVRGADVSFCFHDGKLHMFGFGTSPYELYRLGAWLENELAPGLLDFAQRTEGG